MILWNHFFIRKSFNLSINNLLSLRRFLHHILIKPDPFLLCLSSRCGVAQGKGILWAHAHHQNGPMHNRHDLVLPKLQGIHPKGFQWREEMYWWGKDELLYSLDFSVIQYGADTYASRLGDIAAVGFTGNHNTVLTSAAAKWFCSLWAGSLGS